MRTPVFLRGAHVLESNALQKSLQYNFPATSFNNFGIRKGVYEAAPVFAPPFP
jgi:hypothetical protein